MAGKGAQTREKILDTAQAMVLDHGFSGVSVDKLIESLGMTKGAFFHHFRNKADLAHHLIRRYADADTAFFEQALERGDKLSSDPLQQVLIMIGLYIEEFSGLAEPYPGCLLASYTYELQAFDEDVRNIINDLFRHWRQELLRRFRVIEKKYPPREPVDFSSLADEFLVIIEGAFILSKSLNEPDIVIQQLQHYKHYLELIFQQEQ